MTSAEVIAMVIETHKDSIGTHYSECWKYHAGCLAVLLRDLGGARHEPEPVAHQPSERWPRRNDYFDPPLTNRQMEQVQECINDALRADGAPKPEREGKEYRRVKPDGFPVYHATFGAMPVLDEGWSAEYRSFTEWLPVEGESK